MSTVRLDVELVRRGLARARGQADELVRAGRVSVAGRPATRSAQKVTVDTVLVVEPGEQPDYVGRGALKLAGLLDDLAATTGRGTGPVVAGRRCLDAGASTGGFTQVLLERGAAHVVAVDVGHGQLAAVLRDDSRVEDRSGTSVRRLSASDVDGAVDLLVADLSFISLSVVLPDLAGLVLPGGDLLLMVKPQFEVGKARLGSGGVVRDPALRVTAVEQVARSADDLGLHVRAVRASRWPGPSGNVEYFLWLTLPSTASVPGGTVAPEPVDDAADGFPPVPRADLPAVVRTAVQEGPS